MHVGDEQLDETCYEGKHISSILTEIRKNFDDYWQGFAKKAKSSFQEAIERWTDSEADYLALLDPGFLDEFEPDPNSFKAALRSKCPIIRRSLNSPQEEMKRYKKAFNIAKGRQLLTITSNIAAFGREHNATFDDKAHEAAQSPADLALTDLLDDEDYGVQGAIGGGIRSQFLFALYPHAFPLRSRPAVWALYFLAGKKDFGVDHGSEFLMIDVDRTSTQQNYFYPYDLFAFYSLNVFHLLRSASARSGVLLPEKWRYVYVDTFYNYVHDRHLAEVTLLKGEPENEHVD